MHALSVVLYVVFVVIGILIWVYLDEEWNFGNWATVPLYLALLSPTFVEYPDGVSEIVVLQKNQIVASYPYGLFEPFAMGKIAHVPNSKKDDVSVPARNVEDVGPVFVEVPGFVVHLRIVDANKYASIHAFSPTQKPFLSVTEDNRLMVCKGEKIQEAYAKLLPDARKAESLAMCVKRNLAPDAQAMGTEITSVEVD
ncbi:MAG: hypothetical protein HGA67_01420 [Candidatus Yonathbacteria bacterium]|nr:hypothetical protein [Candidatus Yonathbacteria bacterium]